MNKGACALVIRNCPLRIFSGIFFALLFGTREEALSVVLISALSSMSINKNNRQDLQDKKDEKVL